MPIPCKEPQNFIAANVVVEDVFRAGTALDLLDAQLLAEGHLKRYLN